MKLDKLILAVLGIMVSNLLIYSLVSIAQEKIVVSWWYESPEAEYEEVLRNRFVKSFETAHPNIQIDLVFKEDPFTTARTAVAVGAGPDIIPTYVSDAVFYLKAGEFLLPLDKYIEKFDWKKVIFPWALDIGRYKGKLYSLPLTYETMVLWYNKTLFDRNGWLSPQNKDELYQVSEKMEAQGIMPFAHGNADWRGTNEWFVGILYSNYAGADNVYKALTQQIRCDDPVFVEAIELLNDIFQRGWFNGLDYYSLGWDDLLGSLAEGKSGMHMGGTWWFHGIPDRFDETDNNWAWARLPVLGEGVTPVLDLGIGFSVAINAASKHPDAAAEVLNWMFNDPKRAALIMHEYPGEWIVPIRIPPEAFPAEFEPRQTQALQTMADVFEAGNYGYTTWTFWPPRTMKYIIEGIERVWGKEITPAEYMAEQQRIFAEESKEGSVPPLPPR